ncbi:Uncharacterised protein [Serratia proteamaculans]|uniref:hypothetical protein n=1 Tax=Serratia proteamaculans TaxID=28151 RepID=UPI0021783008|nr:hypothetical protein [Serratia proteamaculans]CAI1882239.1 Uncharacterised protein [Serratia proteamaculans]
MKSRNKKISNVDKIISMNVIFRNKNRSFFKNNARPSTRVMINKYFNELSPSEIFMSSEKIHNHRYFRDLPLITKITDKKDFYLHNVPYTNIDKSIAYILGCVRERKDDLNYFIDKEKNISSLILNDEIDLAYAEINNIETKLGVSAWSISLKSSLFDFEGKNKEKQRYLNSEVLNDGNGYYQYISKKLSSKFDVSGSFIQNTYSYKNSLSSLPGESAEHFIYKLSPIDYNHPYNFEIIFNNEKNSTIIDAYKTLQTYLIYCIVNETENDLGWVKKIIQTLKDFTNDELSKNLSYLFYKESHWVIDRSNFEVIDSYTSGDYERTVEFFRNNKNLKDDFTLYEIYSKSLERGSLESIFKKGLLNDIIICLSSIYRKNEDYTKNYNILSSIVFAFGSLPWFVNLSIFLSLEGRYLGMSPGLEKIHTLISSFDSPYKANFFDKENSTSYLDAIRSVVPESQTLKLFECITNGWIVPTEVVSDTIRRNKYNAIRLLNENDHESAFNLLNNIEVVNLLSKNEYSEIIANALIRSGKLTEATYFVASKVIGNKSLIPMFNIGLLCELIKDEINNLNGIAIPNLLSIHTRYINDNYKPIFRYSLENFFDKNGLTGVDDFISKSDFFDEDHFNYFLEYVCIPDVMRLSLAFSGTDDIEKNRIKICNYLLKISSKNEEVSEELISLAKSQVLKIASKQVDNSKIYADTSGLKGQDNSGLFDNYQQFVSLTKSHQAISDEEYLQSAFIYVLKDEGLLADSVSDRDRSFGEMEKDELFFKLLSRIRDEFVFGVNGLNSNLSTRIRHGHFPSTIRRKLVEERLITPKNSKGIEHKTNEYWLDKFSFLTVDERNGLDDIFKKFSFDIERTISEVNDEWFQVKVFGDEVSKIVDNEIIGKRNALFDFNISQHESYYIQNKIASFDSYADFIRTIIDYLWSRTDLLLEKIRFDIEGKLRETIFNLVRELQSKVHGIINDEDMMHDFNNSIGKCKEYLNVSIELISSWFRRIESIEIPFYDFDTVVEIAKKAADVDVVTRINAPKRFHGRTLSSFVDILYIVFENAVTKSQFKKEDLVIELDFDLREDLSSSLTITNNCLPVNDVFEENKSIQIYRERYVDFATHIKLAQGEGRSGLIKIAKILSKDLRLEHSVTMQYSEVNAFSIEFCFSNLKGVLSDENSNR